MDIIFEIKFILWLLFFLFMIVLSILILTFPAWHLEMNHNDIREYFINKFGKIYGNVLDVLLGPLHTLCLIPVSLTLWSCKFIWSAELMNNFSVWTFVTFIFEWIVCFFPIANIYFIVNNLEYFGI